MLTIPNSKELLAIHPKSKKALGEWILEQAKQASTTVGEEDLDGVMTTLLMWQPRQLFDFFDKYDVRIAIVPHTDDKGFTYYNSKEYASFYGESRVEAEKKALEQAFKTLETLL